MQALLSFSARETSMIWFRVWFVVLACLAVNSSLSAQTVDISKCVNIKDDEERLQCFDVLGKPKSDPDVVKDISVLDLILDGQSVMVRGWAHIYTPTGTSFRLSKTNDAFDSQDASIDNSELPHDQLKRLYENCSKRFCQVRITGKIFRYGTSEGFTLHARNIEFHD
jgi:hypothetical protein